MTIFNTLTISAQTVYSVPTAVPAFIGYTEKAIDGNGFNLSGIPKIINNLNDYLRYFGNTDSPYYKKIILDVNNYVIKTEVSKFLLYQSIMHFFLNGGSSCFIVSIGNYNSISAKADFIKGLDSISKYDEPTLLLFPDAVNLPGTDLYEIQKAALRQAGTLGDRFCILDIKFADSKATHDAVINEFRESIGDEYLGFGAVYSPYLKPVPQKNISYNNWKDVLYKNNSTIKLRDLTTDTTILQKIDELETAINNQDPQAINLEHNLRYLFPLIEKITQQLNQLANMIPPSGAVAGIYCKTDAERGVWKNPSGTYTVINSVLKSAYTFNKEDENKMAGGSTGKYINPIRYFPASGFTIWGGRTLSADHEWRYISTRRFINYLDESIKKSITTTSFSEFSTTTWTEIKKQVSQFIHNIFRQGALQGRKPAEAYFVKLGLGETMTVTDVEEKRQILMIGLSVHRPAEFIIRKYVFEMP